MRSHFTYQNVMYHAAGNHDTWRVVWDMEWVEPVFLRFVVDAQGAASALATFSLGEADEAQALFHRRK